MLMVYVAGNPLVREDSIPLRLMKRLQKKFPDLVFRELEPTDNMPDEKDLTIIDTVIGIDKVTVITDIEKIVTGKVYSLHDFDLGFNLKLMKKMGKLESVSIIGVPPHINEEEALTGIEKTLRKMQ
jgi:Ni,Fe-hydrogenase maturation factor